MEAYVRCHVDCLAETYQALMPAAFAEQQRRSVPDRIEQTRLAWPGWTEESPPTTVWLGLDPAGTVLGVARSGPGPQPWESELGAPAPPVSLQLHHVYTATRVHGSGLGQALLDAAVADLGAYLWILRGNARAERFYSRNGFRPDGVELDCGPTWFHHPMFRMVRMPPPRT